MFEVHIFKHSLFHVGRHPLDHGRLPDVRCDVCGVFFVCIYVACVVWGLCCCCCEHVVLCVVLVVCDGVWCGVWVLCGVGAGAGVVWRWCVCFSLFSLNSLLSLSCSLSFFFLSFFSHLSSLSLLSSLFSPPNTVKH